MVMTDAKPHAVPGSIHPDAAGNREAYMWLKCMRCACIHHLPYPFPCEAEFMGKAMGRAWCPECDAGAKDLTFAKNDEVTLALGVQVTPKQAGSNIAAWMVNGETGASSKCMAGVAMGGTGMDKYGFINYPHDPDDLNRCIKLVKAAPEVRDAFPKIAALNAKWAVIIEHWDELVAMFHDEAGEDWAKRVSAKKTYARMAELLGR